MKPMRVLNCTKRQRKAIFAIADEVGCPVMHPDTFLNETRIENNPDIGFDGNKIRGLFNYECDNNVSFSEFITELLKYEKPKVWVKRSDSTCHYKYDIDGTVTISFVLPQSINSRYHTMTYEAQEK